MGSFQGRFPLRLQPQNLNLLLLFTLFGGPRHPNGGSESGLVLGLVLYEFQARFGPRFVSQNGALTSKTGPKNGTEPFAVFGPILAQDRPRWSQNGPRRVNMLPICTQEGPQIVPDAQK